MDQQKKDNAFDFVSSFESEDTLFFPPSQNEVAGDFDNESDSKGCDAGDDLLTKAAMELMGKKCAPSTSALSGETPKKTDVKQEETDTVDGRSG